MYLFAKLSSLETSFSSAGKDFYLFFFSLVSVMIILNLFQNKLLAIRPVVPWYRFALHSKHFHVVEGVGLSPSLQAVQAGVSPAVHAGV